MRNNLTVAETLMWERLNRKQLGYKFRKQHPIFRYILDFYCHEKSLAIEVDGDVHASSRDYDEYRDEFLQNIGIETLRFMNNEIIINIDSVISEIRKKTSMSFIPHAPSGGQGGDYLDE